MNNRDFKGLSVSLIVVLLICGVLVSTAYSIDSLNNVVDKSAKEDQTKDSKKEVKREMDPPRVALEYNTNYKGQSKFKLSFELDEGWHINALEPADEFLIPIEITNVCKGNCDDVKILDVVFPKPDTLYEEALELHTPIYQGKTNFEIPIVNADTSGAIFKTTIFYQACTDGFCLPPTSIDVEYPKKAEGVAGDAENSKEASINTASESQVYSIGNEGASSIGLLEAILFAFLGGLLLNLMPCVLPVLSLKVLSLVQQAKESKKQRTKYAGAFSAGVIVSFWILATVILVLKHAGESVGWGFQFQNPMFISALCLIVFVFALNLFGLFEINLNYKLQTSAAKAESKEGYLGSFLKGGLMTFLSTPCSAPFLAPAMGWAFTQSDYILFLSFSAAALGLALPYFLLTRYPFLLKKVPKPGPWMNNLKQFMGFLLLVTALWTLSVLSAFGGILIVERFVILLLSLSLLIWIFGKLQFKLHGLINLIIVISLLAISFLGVSWSIDSIKEQEIAAMKEMEEQSMQGEEKKGDFFDREALMAEIRGGQTVLLDFTADWCLTCKTLEKTVIHSKVIQDALKKNNVKLKVADWTKKDPVITGMLQEFGRSGVPIYVFYPAGNPESPILLPDWITNSDVLKGIEKAKELSK